MGPSRLAGRGLTGAPGAPPGARIAERAARRPSDGLETRSVSIVEPERRRHERTAVVLPATLTRIGPRPTEVRGTTVDLSVGGAAIVSSGQLAVGDVVVVSVQGPGVSVEQQGLIVGRQADPAGSATLNVAFKTVDAATAADLERLLPPLS